MKRFRFLDWNVYADSKKLFREILEIAEKLPPRYRIDLGSQLLRSAQSVVLNIAEGSGKTSDKELNRYIDIALGSSYETLANLDLLRDSKFLEESRFIRLKENIGSICNQLGAFRKTLD